MDAPLQTLTMCRIHRRRNRYCQQRTDRPLRAALARRIVGHGKAARDRQLCTRGGALLRDGSGGRGDACLEGTRLSPRITAVCREPRPDHAFVASTPRDRL